MQTIAVAINENGECVEYPNFHTAESAQHLSRDLGYQWMVELVRITDAGHNEPTGDTWIDGEAQ